MNIAVAVVIRDEKFLLQRRRRGSSFVLEFPCGKLERTESFIEAAKRELIEETGLEAKYTGKHLVLKATDGKSDIGFVLLKIPDDQTPKMTAPQREQTFYWVSPQEIPPDEMHAADNEFIRKYIQNEI